jgi:tRNA A37 N6-isopentenylltransferase MiaA
VLVGGTHYYLQSLLWRSLTDETLAARTEARSFAQVVAAPVESVAAAAAAPAPAPADEGDDAELRDTVRRAIAEGITVEGPVLYELLRRVDPDMAQRLHPNDSRKITRSLQACRCLSCQWC